MEVAAEGGKLPDLLMKASVDERWVTLVGVCLQHGVRAAMAGSGGPYGSVADKAGVGPNVREDATMLAQGQPFRPKCRCM